MARVKCEVCGKLVTTTTGNYIFANGIHQHKKCPAKSTMTEEEKKARRSLTDAIDWIERKTSNDPEKKIPQIRWNSINACIKRLQEQGYTFEQMEYALKWFVEIQGNQYKGFGIVAHVIEDSLSYRRKLENIQKKSIEVEKNKSENVEPEIKLRVTSKPTFY